MDAVCKGIATKSLDGFPDLVIIPIVNEGGITEVSHLMGSGLVRLCGVMLSSDGGRKREKGDRMKVLPHDLS